MSDRPANIEHRQLDPEQMPYRDPNDDQARNPGPDRDVSDGGGVGFMIALALLILLVLAYILS